MMPEKMPEVHSLVTELSKRVVTDVAPEELDLFDEYVEAYFKDPTPPSHPAGTSDAQLGSGLEVIAAASTPAILAMVTAVVSFIMEQAIKALKDESSELIRAKVKGVFDKLRKKEPTSNGLIFEFSQGDLKVAREMAVKQAMLYGVNSAEAERMADQLLQPLWLKS